MACRHCHIVSSIYRIPPMPPGKATCTPSIRTEPLYLSLVSCVAPGSYACLSRLSFPCLLALLCQYVIKDGQTGRRFRPLRDHHTARMLAPKSWRGPQGFPQVGSRTMPHMLSAKYWRIGPRCFTPSTREIQEEGDSGAWPECFPANAGGSSATGKMLCAKCWRDS